MFDNFLFSNDTLCVPSLTSHLIVLILSFRAIWHDKEFFPTSWQLDRTEGPCRVRCRLQRCHLDIDEKFIMPEYQKARKKVNNFSHGNFISVNIH